MVLSEALGLDPLIPLRGCTYAIRALPPDRKRSSWSERPSVITRSLEALGAGGMGEVYRAHSLRYFRCAALLLAVLLAPSCTDQDSSPLPLTAEVPLHLEQHPRHGHHRGL